MDKKALTQSVRRSAGLGGWRLDWHGQDCRRTTNLYMVDGSWECLGDGAKGREFVLPGGFDAHLDGLGSKTLRDGFGREAKLTSELVIGEVTPVIIDHDGNRYELKAA